MAELMINFSITTTIFFYRWIARHSEQWQSKYVKQPLPRIDNVRPALYKSICNVIREMEEACIGLLTEIMLYTVSITVHQFKKLRNDECSFLLLRTEVHLK